MNVLVAGAGPAGARLASALASAGWEVTLVDPLQDPHHNAYSSAALPLDDAVRLGLPSSCHAAAWQGWQLIDPNAIEHQWWSNRDLGVVLDFGQLRSHLWDRARQAGVELLTGWRVQLDELHQNHAELTLVNRDGRRERRSVRCLIDATGARRCLLRQAKIPVDTPQDPLLCGQGVEWLIQADDRGSAHWRDRLSFFLGTRWVLHGYGWVFPMADNRLKVGVCRLRPPHPSRGQQGLGSALVNLLHCCGLADCPVLDRHGGLVSSSVQRLEPMGWGALLAIGDAASTANLLGGEGIRHALASADHLAEALFNHSGDLRRGMDPARLAYARDLKRSLGANWTISGRLARRTWWGLQTEQADKRLERLIAGLSAHAEADELVDLLFRYRFQRYGWRLVRYLF